jgi:hypothetical protein
MTRIKVLLSALVLAFLASIAPAAHAQVSCLGSVNTPNCFVHFVGAGATAQFSQSAIAADVLAGSKLGSPSTPVYATATQCVYHWTAKTSANLIDNRGTVAIPIEPGNIWIVWIANLDAGTVCPSTGGGTISSGNNGITDIWLTAGLDGTIGVRGFLAQNTSANGGSGIAVQVIPNAPGNLLGTGANILFPDNGLDVTIASGATNIPIAIGTDQAGIKDVHVNAALTELTPADALFVTNRAMATLNTSTYAGLGYKSSANVGESILTSEGTGTKATPVKFAITGNDPITHDAIRSYQSFPIGAAPLIFVMNNGAGIPLVTNLATGVVGDGVTDTKGYPAAHLFDGTTSCDTDNAAFGGNNDGLGTALTLFLFQPTAGTANTVEYNVFRTTGNTKDSQEVGINPVTANPLANLACDGGKGFRSRAIGTSEEIGTTSTGVLGTAYSLGYIFTGFVNLQKFGGASHPANFNYLTVDGVDPFGFATPIANQGFPNCKGPCTAASYWNGGYSYPTLRDGSYKVWSIYRWLVPVPDSDPYGPTALAQSAEDNVDSTVADFVPFATSSGSDGLAIYRSHYTQSGVTCTGSDTCNGTATAANTLDGGNTLGLGDNGGDMGGLIVGPFGISQAPGVVSTNGYVTTSATCTKKKGYKVTFKSGFNFVASSAWENQTIVIGGVSYTTSPGVLPTTTTLYVGGNSISNTCTGPQPSTITVAVPYAILGIQAPAATTTGLLGKKE